MPAQDDAREFEEARSEGYREAVLDQRSALLYDIHFDWTHGLDDDPYPALLAMPDEQFAQLLRELHVRIDEDVRNEMRLRVPAALAAVDTEESA